MNPPPKLFHLCVCIVAVALSMLVTFFVDIGTELSLMIVFGSPVTYLLVFFVMRKLLTKEVKIPRWGGIVHTKRIWRWRQP